MESIIYDGVDENIRMQEEPCRRVHLDNQELEAGRVQQLPPSHALQQLVYICLLPLILEVAHSYQD